MAKAHRIDTDHPDMSRLDDPKLLRSFSYIDGKWTAATDGASLRVTNPADGSEFGEIAALSCDDSAAAIDRCMIRASVLSTTARERLAKSAASLQ